VNKVVRYISRYPCYRFIGSVPVRQQTAKRRFAHYARSALHTLARPFPESLANYILDDSIVRYSPRRENASILAFRKIAEDERDFWWCPHF